MDPAAATIPADPLPILVKVRLSVEILATYGVVRARLRTRTLPRLLEEFRTSRRRSVLRLGHARGVESARLAGAVTRTLYRRPLDSRCLTLSLVLFALLVRRGLSPALIIAVRSDGSADRAAHAWVELDGRPLLAPATEEHARLVTL